MTTTTDLKLEVLEKARKTCTLSQKALWHNCAEQNRPLAAYRVIAAALLRERLEEAESDHARLQEQIAVLRRNGTPCGLLELERNRKLIRANELRAATDEIGREAPREA